MPSAADHNPATVEPSTPKQPVICVFCGASQGNSPAHVEAARALGRTLARSNARLIYGGGTVGIMGELAKSIVAESGTPDSAHGIIPRALLRYERHYSDEEDMKKNGELAESEKESEDPRRMIDEKTFGRTSVVPDMHTRKQMMAQAVMAGGPGSGFVALTGGYGTLEELMEVVTWNQLGIHGMPVVLFNVEGYFDGLLQWVRGAVDAGFVAEGNAGIMVEARDSEEVVARLRDYRMAEGRFKLSWNED